MTTALERNPSIFKYAELVKKQHRTQAQMSAGQRAAQLGYSSLDDTFLPVLDVMGQVRMAIGRQPDNTYAITYANGDPPPRPTEPTVVPREGACLVGWDGNFEGAKTTPGDFARVDIHISEEPGFEPTGATVVGFLLAESATLVPVDHETHYVKLVAVTLADVISPPTDELAVLPEPISQIAAGAIGAEQLGADIVLINHRLIAGNPAGSRLEFNGYSGLELYNEQNQRTIHLDHTTGDSVITGQIRTTPDNSGQRMVWNPDTYSDWGVVGILFFDETRADQYCQIASGSLPYLRDNGNYGPTINLMGPYVDDMRAFTQITDLYQAGIMRRTPDGTNTAYGVLKIDEAVTDLIQGHFDPQPQYPRGQWWSQLQMFNPQQLPTGASMFGHHTRTSTGTPGFLGLTVQKLPTLHATFVYSIGQVQFIDAYEGGGVYVDGLEFRRLSSRDVKENVQDLPSSALEALRHAPVKRYHYADSAQPDNHIGVMAEDLPEWLVHHIPRLGVPAARNPDIAVDPNEHRYRGLRAPEDETQAEESPTDYVLGVGLGDQVGWLLAAVQELDTEVDELRNQVGIRLPKRGLL